MNVKGCKAVLVAALLLAGSGAIAAPSFHDFTADSLTVERQDRFELTFTLSGTSYTNPFDPAQVDVSAVFDPPSGGAVAVNGFYCREFTRSGPPEVLTPGAWVWKVRFTPDEVGTWTYEVTAADPGTGTGTTGQQSFTCVASSRRGYVRPSPDDPRYLRYDDGTQFVPVGSNVSWASGPDYTYLYDYWLPEMTSYGANYARYWMCSWYHGIEWSDPGETLGDYSVRQDEAWRLDHDIELARACGMVVMLCLVNHGSVSTWCDAEWDGNPYNFLNGGPCFGAEAFFTHSTAKALFKRRLRYIVARWGYASNLIWELFNEADLTDGSMADIAAWHLEMAAYVRSLDDRHMITTSFASRDNHPPTWNMADIDFTQFHDYTDPVAPEDSQRAIVAQYRTDYPAKPVFGGEFGFTSGPGSIANDPDGIHFHNGMWGSVLSEAAGASALWWWDEYIDPQDLFYHYRGIANFTSSLDYQNSGFAFSRPSATSGLKVFALKGPATVAAWVLNSDYNYAYVRDNGPPAAVVGGVISFTGLANDGLWDVEWWDTDVGAVSSTDWASSSGGDLDLAVPPVGWDLGLRMTLNEPNKVLVVESGGSTDVAEGGGTDSYNLLLTSQPAFDVTITVSPDPQVTAAPPSLTFTAANWGEPQAVTVTAVDDEVIEGGHVGVITHAASSNDGGYDGVDIAPVTVTVADNEAAAVTPFGGGCAAGAAPAPAGLLLVGLLAVFRVFR